MYSTITAVSICGKTFVAPALGDFLWAPKCHVHPCEGQGEVTLGPRSGVGRRSHSKDPRGPPEGLSRLAQPVSLHARPQEPALLVF